MNRQKYFNYIEERLATLAIRIKSRGKLNILDLHIHCEDFYSHFLNLLYGYQLQNLNSGEKSNYEAIDLIDEKNKIYIQVSATASKTKIESTLAKEVLKNHSNFTFKFISISIDDDKLKDKTYNNPFQIKFDPKSDIITRTSILSDVKNLGLEEMESIFKFIEEELSHENKNKNLDYSNLTKIINLLAQEDLSETSPTVIPFAIKEKITYNQLNSSKSMIDNYTVYHSTIKKIYETFDREGLNKSISVLSRINREYIKSKKDNPDELFDKVRNNLRETIINSGNYEAMASEELDLCLDILLVDAFIRCKIFENPQENLNAST
jgi:hypothetical protein